MAKLLAEHIFKGSILIFILSGIAAVIGYAVRMYLARNLTLEEFGLFYAIFSFIGFFSIVKDLGLGQTMVKFIAEYIGPQDDSKVKSIFALTIFIQTIIIIIVAFFFIIYADPISIIYFKLPQAALPLKIIALCGIIGTVMSALQQAAQGIGNMLTYALTEPIRISLTFIFIVSLIYMGIIGVAYAYVIATIITSVFLIFSLRTTLVIRGRMKINLKLSKKLLNFGLPVFLSSLSSLVLVYTDTIIITIFRGVEDVGLYQTALPTSQLLWILVNSLSVVLLPTVSQMWAKNQIKNLSISLTHISKFSFALIIPFSIIMLAFATDIISIFFGPKFIAAAPVLQILAINSIFYTLFVIFTICLTAIGKPYVNSKITATISIINLVLNLILVPQFGIVAAASTTLLSYLIGSVLAYYSLRKSLPIHLNAISMLKIFAGGILSLIVIIATKSILVFDFRIEIIVSLLIALSVYTVFIFKSGGIKIEELKHLMKLNVPIPKFVLRIVAKLAS